YLLEHISKIILMKIPDAIIIGTTTAGEILNGKMLHESIVISFSIFNQTYLKSIHLVGDDSEALGYTAAQTIVDKDTKCVIMFADGLQRIGDDILRGFNRGSLQDVIVAGGMSGDNNIMHATYCIHGTTIFQGGIVAVALANPELEVFHTYNLSWHPIGREMTITQAKGNIVYQINYLPVLDVYEHYLGENVVSNMPGSMIEFPLIYH
ncbi:FIST signal transduction protein, partial [Sulfuricurvum sp.]|uniref:FIST signal transduction protein n=1 Tax=Sulfuricurvum sp. TaxID=2025608 RepID=UPI003BB60200